MGMFDKDNTQQNEVTAEQAMEQLVGEGKKYATAAEAAKALLHSQLHIGTLEDELAELRTKVGKGQTVEEIVAELRKTGLQQQQQAPVQDPNKTAADAPDVGKLVEEALNKHMGVRQAAENQKAVKDHFIQKFGTKAGEMFDALGKQLGMDLEGLSASNPAAVKALAEQMLGGGAQQGGGFSLQGRGQGGGRQAEVSQADTRSGIIAQVRALNLKPAEERKEKFKRLNDGLNRATLEGRVDEFDR